MDISLDGSGSLLPFVIVGIIIIVIIVATFLIQQSGKKLRERNNDTSAHAPGLRLAYQPEAKPKPVYSTTTKTTPSVRATPHPGNIDLISTRKDLAESLVALGEKYSLGNFTIATADGLVLGSSGGDAAQIDAATYSELFKNNHRAVVPGVTLFGLSHKGSDLIGIIRTPAPLPQNIVQHVEADTKVILNWWI